MFSDLWWLNYCFCCGRGIGDIGNPLIGSEGKQLCLHSKCQMTNVGDPLCGGLSVFCCQTTQFRLPPSADTPICVLCSKELVGKSGSGWKPELFDFKPAFGDQFWLVYMFCCGTALTAPGANGRPLIGSLQKVICVEQATRMVALSMMVWRAVASALYFAVGTSANCHLQTIILAANALESSGKRNRAV